MLTVIVPTRGRPENAKRLKTQFVETHKTTVSRMEFIVDDDDPRCRDYYDAVGLFSVNIIPPRGGMGPTLNAWANKVTSDSSVRYIGFMGDDHYPRHEGWDREIVSALNELKSRVGYGIVYGNDLVQGENLPTAVFMTSNIVKALGWMALPGCKHLWLDNTWKILGEELGCLRYLPDTVIEHLHPVAEKAEWDEGYHRVNSKEIWDNDERVFKEWRDGGGMAEDVARVRAFRG